VLTKSFHEKKNCVECKKIGGKNNIARVIFFVFLAQVKKMVVKITLHESFFFVFLAQDIKNIGSTKLGART
jgi:hypothetical protein